MNDESADDASTTWQTERMTLLDNRELINAMVRAVNGRVPGTDKEYDANKVASELVEMLFGELRDSSGVHLETVLATLGALAGFAGQMAIREALIKTGKLPQEKAFVVARASSGETYYFGEMLSDILYSNKPGIVSLSGMVGGAAQQAGARTLPNIADIARHVAGTVAAGGFGIPRLPSHHMPRIAPLELLDRFWNPIRNFLVVNVHSPPQWPLVIGLAAQKVIIMAKDQLDPALATQIVMEAAIPLASVDPAKVHFAYFQSY